MRKGAVLIVGLIVIVAIVALILSQRPSGPEVYRVGAILPLTGPAATAGEFQKRGIELAVEQVNEGGGIGGIPIEVLFADSKNLGREGLTVYRRLTDLDKVPIIIAAHSGVVSAIAPQVPTDGSSLLLITISSVPGITQDSPYIFRYYVTSENESQKMASFAQEKLQLTKVGVFYINDDFGLGGKSTFVESFTQLGGEVVWEDAYDKEGSDFRNSLAGLVATEGCEALYVIGYDKPFALAVKQAREVGFKGEILTSIGMSIPDWIRLAGESAEGVYLTTSRFDPSLDDETVRTFVNAYQAAYDRPPNFMSAYCYDIVQMLAKAIEANDSSPQGVRVGLMAMKDFRGVIGRTEFDQAREGRSELLIRRISGGKPVLYTD